MNEAMDEGFDPSEEGDLFEHYRFVADSGQQPLRIDKFLLDRVPNTSRNKLQLAAKSGYIRANGAAVKQNYRVKPGDAISIELPHPVREFELIPEELPINIVYEDEQVLVLNKQAGMVVHPGYGNYTGTLVNGLLHHFGRASASVGLDDARPGLVHRIDKLTTGLMVIAKTEPGMTHLSNQFFERTVERRYTALVWGDLLEDGTVTGNIGRSLKNRKVMDVFEDGVHGKHAVTHYKVLKRFGYITLIECKLETGRTHQIRVHMKHLGHPLFNDPEYGGNRVLKGPHFSRYRQFVENCFELLPRQALHARTLGFEHPHTGQWMQFNSELPDDMNAVIAKWERYTPNS
jgi:23S rRNA pseudouridine1911/1915/1917 synthase